MQASSCSWIQVVAVLGLLVAAQLASANDCFQMKWGDVEHGGTNSITHELSLLLRPVRYDFPEMGGCKITGRSIEVCGTPAPRVLPPLGVRLPSFVYVSRNVNSCFIPTATVKLTSHCYGLYSTTPNPLTLLDSQTREDSSTADESSPVAAPSTRIWLP